MTVRQQKIRWRLILGDEAEDICGGVEGQDADRDAALEYLYGREGQGRNRRTGGRGRQGGGDRQGTLDPSNLTVPEWINAVHTLFPQRTIERIEKDPLQPYQVTTLLTNLAL